MVGIKSNILIHSPYELTLVDYLNSLTLKNIQPIVYYNIPRISRSILKQYSYVPQEYLKLVKGLIKFVLDMHKKDLSFVFKIGQPSVIGDEFKIWKLRFTTSTDVSKDFIRFLKW